MESCCVGSADTNVRLDERMRTAETAVESILGTDVVDRSIWVGVFFFWVSFYFSYKTGRECQGNKLLYSWDWTKEIERNLTLVMLRDFLVF